MNTTRFRINRRSLLALSGGTALLSASGLLGKPAWAQDAGQLVWAKPLETTQLDPHTSILGSSWQVLHLVYDSLVDVDGTLKPIPGLAETWEEESPLSYLFTLREGLMFSDGTPLTVEDVQGSLLRVVDPATGSFFARPLGPITAVDVVGSNQVRITLSAPHAPLLSALAATMASILPISKIADGTFDPTREMLGAGPYRVVEHVQDDHWLLERNPHYWQKGLPLIERILVRIVPSDNARIAMLSDGSVDIASFEAGPDAPLLLQSVPGIDVSVETSTNYYFLALNAVAEASPFRDERLRQAVALSLNREQIREFALGGVGDPTSVMAPAFAACDTSLLPLFNGDIERARALVAEAGAEGLTFELLVRNIPADIQIAQVIKQGVEQIGLATNIAVVDEGIWVTRAWVDNPSNFDAMISWYVGYGDPALSTLWWNPELAGFTAGHQAPVPALNELIEKAYQTVGPDRAPVLQDLCAAVDANANMIPLVTRQDTIAIRGGRLSGLPKQVEGYVHTLRGIEQADLT